MNENPINHQTPTIAVSLAVAASLHRVLDPASPLHQAVRAGIEQALGELVRTLGIPGQPTVEIIEAPASDKLLRLSVNGRLCRYPDELLSRVYHYVNGVPAGSVLASKRLTVWLTEDSDQPTETAARVEFFCLACQELVKSKPSVLLGAAQTEAYRAALAAASPESEWPGAEWLHAVLAAALDLRISLADQETAATVLAEAVAQGRSREDAAEELIAALRPDLVEIQIAPEYFRAITTQMESEHTLFAMMRDGLFYELGLRYPDFRFVPSPRLKPNSFAFKLNHLATLPCVGLRKDQVLVNDTPERLRLLAIQGEEALNPANANVGSVIDAGFRQAAEAAGLTTWSQAGYLVLSFSSSLRENGDCFVHRPSVEAMLELLSGAFPALTNAVQSKFPVAQLTRVLRRLSREEISIRNLRSILESLVNYDFIVTDPRSLIIFDDRFPASEPPVEAVAIDPAVLAGQARCGLKRYLGHKYTRGQSTLIVYLLAPEIETMIAQPEAAEREAERERILAALRAEHDGLPAGGSITVILTSIEVRTAMRELIAAEFPRLPVVAYQELPPEINIQPITRITLDV